MKKTITIIAAIAAFMSCQKVDRLDLPMQDGRQIRIEMSMAATRVTGTSFEAEDEVALYAVEYASEAVPELQISGNFINNEKLIFNGSSWIADKTLYWSDRPCDFYALYPYQNLTSVEEHAFEIATDQNSTEADGVLGGYEASDLLFAKAEKVSHSDGRLLCSSGI